MVVSPGAKPVAASCSDDGVAMHLSHFHQFTRARAFTTIASGRVVPGCVSVQRVSRSIHCSAFCLSVSEPGRRGILGGTDVPLSAEELVLAEVYILVSYVACPGGVPF